MGLVVLLPPASLPIRPTQLHRTQPIEKHGRSGSADPPASLPRHTRSSARLFAMEAARALRGGFVGAIAVSPDGRAVAACGSRRTPSGALAGRGSRRSRGGLLGSVSGVSPPCSWRGDVGGVRVCWPLANGIGAKENVKQSRARNYYWLTRPLRSTRAQIHMTVAAIRKHCS